MMQTRLDIDENEFRLEGARFWTIQNKSEVVQVAVFIREIQTGILSLNMNIEPGYAKLDYNLFAASSKVPYMWICPQLYVNSYVLQCDYSCSSYEFKGWST